jgi:hypothetical protein
MADVIGVAFYVALALASWAVVVLGTVHAIHAMKRAGWPLAAIVPGAALAMAGLVLAWPLYGVLRLGFASYRKARPGADRQALATELT